MTSEYSEIPKITRIESVPSLKLTSKMSLNRCSLDSTNIRLTRSQNQLDSHDSFQYISAAEAASCNLDNLPSHSREAYKRSEPASLLQLSETNSSGEVSGHATPRSSGIIGPKSILRASKFTPSSKSQEVTTSFGRDRKAKRVTFSVELERFEKENSEVSDEILSKFKWSTADPTPQPAKIEKITNSEPKKGKQMTTQTGWLGPPPPNNELLNSIRSKRGRKIFLQNLGSKSKLNESNPVNQSLDVTEDKNPATFFESFASRAARNFQNNLKNKKLPPILPSFSSIQNLTPIGKTVLKDRTDSPFTSKDQEILIQAVYIDSPNHTGYKLNTPNVTFAMPKKETKNKSIFASGNIWTKTPDMKDTSKIFMKGPSRS